MLAASDALERCADLARRSAVRRESQDAVVALLIEDLSHSGRSTACDLPLVLLVVVATLHIAEGDHAVVEQPGVAMQGRGWREHFCNCIECVDLRAR